MERWKEKNMPELNKTTRLFYGWVVAGAAFVVMIVCFGVQYSFGVFFKPLIAEFGWTRAATSGIFSLYMVVRAVFSIVMGYFCDRRGPRLTVSLGAVSMGLGLLFISRSKTIWQLYIFYGVMGGIGAASFYAPLASTVSKWFTKKRGLVLGIYSAGIGIGTVIFSPLTEFFIDTYSWRTSFVILGMMTLGIILASALFLRSSPQEMGLEPEGRRVEGFQAAGPGARDRSRKGLSFGDAWLTLPFWLILFVEMVSYMVSITPLVHIVPFATDTGISPMVAASLLAVIGGCSIVGRVVTGAVSDKVGAKNLLPVMLMIEAVMLFFLMESKGTTMFYLFAILFGLAYGGSVPLIPAVTADFFGPGSMGTIFGVISFGGILGGAFGPLLAGTLHDSTQSYGTAFLAISIVAAVGALLAFFLRGLKPRHAFS
jgi:MFS family permease